MVKSIDEKHLQDEKRDLLNKLNEANKQLEKLKNNIQALSGAVQMTDKLLSNFIKENESEPKKETDTPKSKKSLEDAAKDMVSQLGDDDIGKVDPS